MKFIDPIWQAFRKDDRDAKAKALIEKLEPLLVNEELQVIIQVCDEISNALKKVVK